MQNYNFSITKEECDQLEKEYEINDIILNLYKAINYVGGNTTITDAITKLRKETRFNYEIDEHLKSKTALGKI